MSGHSWGAGISQSRLQRGDRHWQPRTQRPSAARASEGTIIYYLHWCEKQLLSLWRHIVLWLLHSLHVWLWVMHWRYSLLLFLFNPLNLFVLADHISEGMTLGNSIPLLPSALSHICHVTPRRRRLQAYRGRVNHAASFSSLTPTFKSVVWNIYQTCVCLAWLQTAELLCSTMT